MRNSKKFALAALMGAMALAAPAIAADSISRPGAGVLKSQDSGRTLGGTHDGVWNSTDQLFVNSNGNVSQSSVGVTDGTITDGTRRGAVAGVYQEYLGRDASAGRDGGRASAPTGSYWTDLNGNLQLSQFNGQGAVQEVYGDLLGRDPSQPKGQNGVSPFGGFVGGVSVAVGDVNGDGRSETSSRRSGLGSLSGLGSMNDLLANGRGGVPPAATVPGGGTVVVSVPDDPFAGQGAGGGTGKTLSANLLGTAGAGAPGAHVKVFDGRTGGLSGDPGAVRGLNFANPGAVAGGGPHVSPAAAKGLNFTRPVR